MADVTYRDTNGVTWLLLEAGGKWFGTADPASPRQYDPMQPDTAITNAQGAAAALVDKYAAAHSSEVTLLVKASPGGGGIVLALLLALLVFTEKKGR